MDLPTFSSLGPEIWGRSFWEFLDAIVVTYPRENCSPEHRNATKQMMLSLVHLLPCPVCRKHYSEFLNRHSLDAALNSRRSFVEFYFLLKKDVSGRTKGGLAAKTPDELWTILIRRMKLARPTAAQLLLAKPTARQPFRVPARVGNVASTSLVKKGCGCGKK